MAKRPVVPPKTALKMFYVYDPGIGNEIGGIAPVKEHDGQRVVFMTNLQAEYWVLAGALGTVPLSEVSDSGRVFIHQTSGGRVPLKDGDRVRTHERKTMGIEREGIKGRVIKVSTRRTAIQNAKTMARAMTQGYHPVTGERAVSQTNEERIKEAHDERKQQSKLSRFMKGAVDNG